MEIKSVLVLDSVQPLSKALDRLLKERSVVLVTKNDSYFGLIDDRHMKKNIADPNHVKCENVSIRTPILNINSSILEKLNAFLTGHFKALPVISDENKILGVFTRSDLLEELLKLKAYPNSTVSELMNAPVFMIDQNEKISTAKKQMKEKKLSKLIVTDSGVVTGVISSLDLTAFDFANQSRGKDFPFPKEFRGADDHQISEFLREEVQTIDAAAKVSDSMRMMASNHISSLIVCDSKKSPKGVISATDIFRNLVDVVSVGPDIGISGLHEEEHSSEPHIKQVLNKILNKFNKTFSFDNISVHVKKGKSVYKIDLHINIDSVPLAISIEDFNLNSGIDKVAGELHNILYKKKEKISDIKR